MRRLLAFVALATMFSCSPMLRAEDKLGGDAKCVEDWSGEVHCVMGGRAYLCVASYGCNSQMSCAPTAGVSR